MFFEVSLISLLLVVYILILILFNCLSTRLGVSIEFTETTVVVKETEEIATICAVKTGDSVTVKAVKLVLCTDGLLDGDPAEHNGTNIDFIYSMVELSFRPGEFRKCHDIPIIDDVLVEAMEKFGICMITADDVIIGEKDKVILTIIDDDCKSEYV